MTGGDDATRDYHVEEFDVLRHERRKLVIILLMVLPDDPVSIATLSELLAVCTSGERPRQLSAEQYNQSRQSLTKSHLQKLEEVNAIETDGNMVSPGPLFERYCTLVMTQECLC